MKTLKLTLLTLAAGLSLSLSVFGQGKVEEFQVSRVTEYTITPNTVLIPSKDLTTVSNVVWRIKIFSTDSLQGMATNIGPKIGRYEAAKQVIVSTKGEPPSAYVDGEWTGTINFRPNDVQNQLNDLVVGIQASKKEEAVTFVMPPIRDDEINEVEK